MATQMRQSERRTDALSKARIVDAAITILDAAGEDALTFRALAEHLKTGAGAIYWHVADKNELMSAAADHVVFDVMAQAPSASEPRDAIRIIALAVFDAIDTHPWVGAQLAREPWHIAVGRIFERVGRQIQAFGVPERAQFDVASTLVSFILGMASQNAANARLAPRGMDRTEVLAGIADHWAQIDPEGIPFIRQIGPQLYEHDDREQFLAGVDLILDGADSIEVRD